MNRIHKILHKASICILLRCQNACNHSVYIFFVQNKQKTEQTRCWQQFNTFAFTIKKKKWILNRIWICVRYTIYIFFFKNKMQLLRLIELMSYNWMLLKCIKCNEYFRKISCFDMLLLEIYFNKWEFHCFLFFFFFLVYIFW